MVIDFLYDHYFIGLHGSFGSSKVLLFNRLWLIGWMDVLDWADTRLFWWSKLDDSSLTLRKVHLGLNELFIALTLSQWLVQYRLWALSATVLKGVVLRLVETWNQIFLLLEAFPFQLYGIRILTWVVTRIDVCVLLLRYLDCCNRRNWVNDRDLLFLFLVTWAGRAFQESWHRERNAHASLLNLR